MKKIFFLVFIFLINSKVHSQTCYITNISPVNFGIYDVASLTPTDSTGSVTILCDRRIQATIYLDRGLYAKNYSTRLMKHSTLNEFLSYNLFTSSDRTTIWGDGSGGSSYVVINARRNRPATAIIYGRISERQNVSIRNYYDVVTITILP